MKITLKDKYKSLQPFVSDDLNELCIITGKNGSGKSQLLELITKKNKNESDVRDINIETSLRLHKIQSEGIIKDYLHRIGHDEWKSIVRNHHNNYKQLTQTGIEFLRIALENRIEVNNHRLNKRLILETPEYKELLSTLFNEVYKQKLPIGRVDHNTESDIIGDLYTHPNIASYNFSNEISKYTGRPISELKDADFYNTPIQEYLIDENDLFSSRLEMIFYNYSLRRDQNRKDYFYKKEENEPNSSISDSEFISENIPPWILINNILDEHNIDFNFKEVTKQEFSTEVQFESTIYKKSNSDIIPFSDLSSGEKVIIGLILKLFTSEYYGKTLKFPDLIILDEPDAHLHPEMSQLLLSVLQETFVNKYGVRIIMTTHSPSTIALASENQVYQLTNGIGTSLKKTTKDDALKILTGFIPTLSIDYKNQRQVFVESPTDVTYYQLLHDKHAQQSNPSYKLYFISNSPGKGNCSQVYKIVAQIRNSGNSTSYGIVDWDKSNNQKGYVIVHGYQERYSVENFILDPIYILCLLIELKNAHGVLEKIGLNKTYNQYLIGSETSEKLTEIVKYFFTEFEKKYSTFKYDSEKVNVEYLNGRKLELPKWYLEMQGHDIVNKIKDIFPAIGGKYRNEGELQNDLSIIMSKSYPFVPKSSIDIIEKIGHWS